jgi:hypothetical protein
MDFILSNENDLNFTKEVEMLGEDCLATFYGSKSVLKKSTICEMWNQVGSYARRYFFHLLRYGRLNKAYLLAIDISDSDLFNDLYYCAMNRGKDELVEACRSRYHELNNKSLMINEATDLNFDRLDISTSSSSNLSSISDTSSSSYFTFQSSYLYFQEENNKNNNYLNGIKTKNNKNRIKMISPKTSFNITKNNLHFYENKIYKKNDFILKIQN